MIILKIKVRLVAKFQVDCDAINNITANINNITISYNQEIKNFFELIEKINTDNINIELKNYIENIQKQKKQFENFSEEITTINKKLKDENINYLKANDKAVDLAEKC